MSAPVEVLIKFYLDHLAAAEQPAAAAAILRQLADDFARNEFRPLIKHNGRLVGNVFMLDADGRPTQKVPLTGIIHEQEGYKGEKE